MNKLISGVLSMVLLAGCGAATSPPATPAPGSTAVASMSSSKHFKAVDYEGNELTFDLASPGGERVAHVDWVGLDLGSADVDTAYKPIKYKDYRRYNLRRGNLFASLLIPRDVSSLRKGVKLYIQGSDGEGGGTTWFKII